MIVAEYGAEGDRDWRRVTVDPDAGTVTFHHCHQPRRFLSAGADPEFTCRLTDLRGVCSNVVWRVDWRVDRRVGRVLEVVTAAGRARLPESAPGFEAVRAALVGGLAPEAGLRWHQYPATGLLWMPVILAAAIGMAILFFTAVAELGVSDRVVLWSVLGLMAAVAIAAVLLTWRGRSQW